VIDGRRMIVEEAADLRKAIGLTDDVADFAMG
jgi:hypothetical protein